MCGFWTVTNAVAGMAASFFTIPMYVVFQKYTQDEYRGRFWGLENSTRTLAICIGFLGGSFLAGRVWLPFLFWVAAAGQLAIGLWAINLKAIRELKAA